MAANPQTKPVDLGCESAEIGSCRPHPPKGAQPVPKAAYRSSCHDKRPQCDSTWLAAAKLGRSVLSEFWTCRHRRQRRRGCRCRDPQYLTCMGRPVLTTPQYFDKCFIFSIQRYKLVIKFIIQRQSMGHVNLKDNTPRMHHITPL